MAWLPLPRLGLHALAVLTLWHWHGALMVGGVVGWCWVCSCLIMQWVVLYGSHAPSTHLFITQVGPHHGDSVQLRSGRSMNYSSCERCAGLCLSALGRCGSMSVNACTGCHTPACLTGSALGTPPNAVVGMSPTHRIVVIMLCYIVQRIHASQVESALLVVR